MKNGWTIGVVGVVCALSACTKKTSDTNGDGGSGGTSSGAETGGSAQGTGGGPTGTGGFATTGVGGAPQTCDPASGDDACTTCSKTSCCDQITACDDACDAAYSSYIECLFPGGGEWSGFSTRYCRDAMAIDDASAAGQMIGCFLGQCSGDSACGAEPRAVFEFPPANGADFSAEAFIEDFCVGCHFPGLQAPSGQDLTGFSSDTAWFAPRGTSNWFELMLFDNIRTRANPMLCGINPDVLPEGCDTLSDPPVVEPGFFSKAQKFPPSGMGMDHLGAPNPCTFAQDGITCPQPTHFERARMVSWVVDGMPQQ